MGQVTVVDGLGGVLVRRATYVFDQDYDFEDHVDIMPIPAGARVVGLYFSAFAPEDPQPSYSADVGTTITRKKFSHLAGGDNSPTSFQGLALMPLWLKEEDESAVRLTFNDPGDFVATNAPVNGKSIDITMLYTFDV